MLGPSRPLNPPTMVWSTAQPRPRLACRMQYTTCTGVFPLHSPQMMALPAKQTCGQRDEECTNEAHSLSRSRRTYFSSNAVISGTHAPFVWLVLYSNTERPPSQSPLPCKTQELGSSGAAWLAGVRWVVVCTSVSMLAIGSGRRKTRAATQVERRLKH